MTSLIILSSLSSVYSQLELGPTEGDYVYLYLVPNQGGGIHGKEEFNHCIRVFCLFSPAK
jgi:hypothetical protein